MDIHTTFLKKEFHHKVKINLKLLDALTKNTDTILFVDLLKRIIQKVPDQRGTCEDLIDHVALKSNEERFMIFRYLAKKCFDGDKCINKYLVKMMDKKEVHKEGFLGEASDEWKKYLAEAAKFLQLKPDTKTCSSLIKLFNMKMVIKYIYHIFL